MSKHTTPIERAILTHYWVSPEPWKRGSEYWTPTDSEIVCKFVSLGLLVQTPCDGFGKIVANQDALRPYMEALAAVPLPTQKWVVA
jgi:hypothetical protein